MAAAGTHAVATARDAEAAARAAIDRSVAYLFARQRDDGSWQDHLPSSAVSTGAALMALHAAGPERDADAIAAGAAWLRDTQNADGSWGDTADGDSTLNASAIALGALQTAAAATSGPAVARGREHVERAGGREALEDRKACTMSTVCLHYLADAALYPRERLGRLPRELILMPRGLRRKLCFTLPGLLSWGVMQAHTRPRGRLERLVDRLSEPRALAWLDGVQQFEGYDGGFEESPLMAAVVLYGLARASVDTPIADRCHAYLLRTRRADGSWPINRDLELSATMFLTLGLQESGHADDPRLAGTIAWTRRCQRDAPFFPTGCPAGGWGWSLPSGWPNTDDTSSALTVLAGAGCAGDDSAPDGVRWLLAQQHRNGSWACFVRGGRLSLDAPTPEMTAHALVALSAAGGLTDRDRPVARGLRFLARAQREDGAIHALWYRNWTAGTAAALDAFACHGRAQDEPARGCVRWLLANQHASGGWGGGGDTEPTVEETAWALLGLLAAGVPARDPRLERAVLWLSERQGAAGGWPPSLIGIYFSSLMYHDDHIANGYALQALGRYRRVLAAED